MFKVTFSCLRERLQTLDRLEREQLPFAATLTLVPLIEYFGLPQSMATFIGGCCGFIGTEKLRDLAIRWGEKKASV